MGNNKVVSIVDSLFSGVQRPVLGLLFGQPDRSFYTNEIQKLGMTGRGALERELRRMTVKKIPKDVLSCRKRGRDDYSLRIDNLPQKPPERGQQALDLE